MESSFHDFEVDRLLQLWDRFFPARYRITAELFAQNTTQHPLFDWGASRIVTEGDEVVAFLAVKRSPNPSLFPGRFQDIAHVSALAFRQPIDAAGIMASAKSILRDRGISHLVFGGDCGHFFPGVPEEATWLTNFLAVEGFEFGSLAYDVERNIATYHPPKWLESELTIGRDFTVRRAVASDRAELAAFLSKEYPGRWTFDTIEKWDEGDHNDIFLLVKGQKIEGFAVTQTAASAKLRAGAVWHRELGESWCALGPIGIASSLRGQKLGHLLMARALEGLRDAGGENCIIDWTTLLDFYGAHGFEKSRTYTKYSLPLSIGPG